jgi:hypothetical protein
MLKFSKLANCKNSVAEILQKCKAVCCPPNSAEILNTIAENCNCNQAYTTRRKPKHVSD